MDKRSPHANDLQLEKIALGEAQPDSPLSPEDEARLAALRQDNAAILARYPAGPQAEQIAARLARLQAQPTKQPARPRWVWLPGLLGAATTLAIVVWFARPPQVAPEGPEGPEGPDVILSKGGAASGSAKLLLYRQRDGRTEPLSDGEQASPGDLVQLALVPGRARYGVLLSIDGRGGVTLHHPRVATDNPTLFTGPIAPPRSAGSALVHSEIRLAQAFRLDAAPDFERFVLVTADEAHREALNVEAVLAAARRLAAEAGRAAHEPIAGLPSGLSQTSLRIDKHETKGPR